MNEELLKTYKAMKALYDSASKAYDYKLKEVADNKADELFNLLENAKELLKDSRLNTYGNYIVLVNTSDAKPIVLYPYGNPEGGTLNKWTIAQNGNTLVSLERGYNKERFITTLSDREKIFDNFDEIRKGLTEGIAKALNDDMQEMLLELEQKQSKLEHWEVA